MNSYISIDYGSKKSWLAYSIGPVVWWLSTVASNTLLEVIPEMIQEKKAIGIVIGMPYNIDGSMSPHARRVENWAKKLEKIIDIPIILFDERLTTSEAILRLDELGIEDGDLDRESAILILEGYLESIE